MRKVVFRVDGNATIGTGHMMRCLALAQALKKQHVSSTFVVSDEAAAICNSRQDWVGEVIVLPANIRKHDEASWLAELCQQTHVDALVLDGYQFDAQYRQSLGQLGLKLVLFDDSNDSGPLRADLIINGADNAEALGYEQTNEGAVLCLGAKYKVMRQEFVEHVPLEWHERTALGIMFGGSDPLNLTLPLLQALQAHSRQQTMLPISLFTGPAYPFTSELMDFLQHTSLNIVHLANCQQVAQEFSHCRLVISAAGSSQFELLACETPAILLVVANNQLNASEQADQQGWCKVMDARGGTDMTALAGQCVKLLADEQGLLKMHQLCAQYKDVHGAKLAAMALIQLCGGHNLNG